MKRIVAASLVGLAALVAGCGGSTGTDKSQFSQEERARLDALRVAGEDAPANRQATGGIGNAFAQIGDGLWERLKSLYNLLSGETPVSAAVKMENRASPDARREGIFSLADERFARTDPEQRYVRRWWQIAFGIPEDRIAPDADFTVRAAAIRSLNRARVRSVKDSKGQTIDLIPKYITALDDESELVRLEAAKALANMPDERAVTVLIRHLDGRAEVRVEGRVEPREETRDVRIAAADALRSFRRNETAQALIRTLQDRDFGVAWQARQSLLLLTGRDFRYDQAAWLEHLRSQKPFA